MDESSDPTPAEDSENSDSPYHSLDLIMEEVDKAVTMQQDQRQDLQGKAATMMGFVGAMIALLLGAQDVIMEMSRVAQILALVAVGSLIVDLFLLSLVYWVRVYRVDPEPRGLSNYLRHPVDKTQLQLLSNKIASFETNRTTIERGAVLLRVAFTVQALITSLLGALLVLAFLTS